MIGISYSSYEKYGCPSCGCDSATGLPIVSFGEPIVKCRACEQMFMLIPDDRSYSKTTIEGKTNVGCDYKAEHVKSIEHPRKGINKWKYKLPDIKPKNGEYFRPRPIGYDLAGFVRCKEAGERILNMVKKILNNDNPKSYLDYRKSEPYYIQFKFNKEEFDLDKIYNSTNETKVLTEDILVSAKN